LEHKGSLQLEKSQRRQINDNAKSEMGKIGNVIGKDGPEGDVGGRHDKESRKPSH